MKDLPFRIAKLASLAITASALLATTGEAFDCSTGPDSQAIQQQVSYSATAPNCGVPSVTVQTLTNPFSVPCFVFVYFVADDDILIDGQVYQSPGTNFTYHDTNPDPCPDANGRHTDRYCRPMAVGEQITLGVKNNFRGYISLSAGVYFSIPTAAEPTKPNDLKLGGDKGDCYGMARYSAHAMLASLNIEDTPIRYIPPRGPAINFTVTYNQREGQQPETFTYSNLGQKWTFNWLSYVTDDPNNASANVAIYVPGGGAEAYSGFNSGSQSYLPDLQSGAVLVRTSTTSYEKDFPDGSRQIYSLSDGSASFPRKIFMTQWIDSAGNAVTIGYDSSFRITTITDALGQVTTLSYELSSDPLKVTKVTEPFPTGRSATFRYDGGQLTTITDTIGIQSVFTYSADNTNFITSLQTPYGVSHFTTGGNGTNRWLKMTDPMGGSERVEYRDNAPGIGGSESVAPSGFTNSGLDVANTFYWDKNAYQLGGPGSDYTTAKIIHWLKNGDGRTSGIPASQKSQLENRVWYAYVGQSDTNQVGSSAKPSQIARVLDNGTTQLQQYEYNNIGLVTKSTDPLGRVTSYVYDSNGVDLLAIYQRNPTGASTDPSGAAADKIAGYTYNSFHEPLTATDTSGQTTTYTYNYYGQVTSIQNAKGEMTNYSYGGAVPNGYLASVTGPQFNGVSHIMSCGYDSAHRVRTITDSADNYAITTDYDSLDRPTQITYPDGTTQQFQYTGNFGIMLLDVTRSKDRRGRWSYRGYTGNRQLDYTVDPLHRWTIYDWCRCGSLSEISDPLGHSTRFTRDIQGRLLSKTFEDQSSIYYTYENTTSRLKSVTDPKNQVTSYQYFVDNSLKQISYTDTSGQPLNPTTPSVGFLYDPNYNRVTQMVDGTGTTTYAYYPVASPPALGAGQLRSVVGSLANSTITYSYDQLGRTTGQAINGAASTVTYDSLGRIATSNNPLGYFDRAYDGVTSRLQVLSYPNGQAATYSYFDNLHDRRLQTLQNLGGIAANLSKFDYTYDPEGQVLTWTKQIGVALTLTGSYGYDLADQLTSATTASLVPPASFNYGYDGAGNRTQDTALAATHSFNSVNEITDSGYTYDANGNLTSDGVTSYFWDAANRVIAIERLQPKASIPPPVPSPTTAPVATPSLIPTPTPSPSIAPVPQRTITRSEFGYDGLGRRVRIVCKVNATDALGNPTWVTLTDNRYVWNGNTLAEERDSTGANVTKRFFTEGEQINGTNYYFTRDHLGSIREMTDSTQKVRAEYDYDPFGNRTRLGGDLDADFGFTGHYYHSGLSLTRYRAYNPVVGRWLSRDPLGNAEISQGPNLYKYVSNNPVQLVDPSGREEDLPPDNGTTGSLGTSRGNYAASQGYAGIAENSRQYPLIYGGALLGPIGKWFGDLFDGLFGISMCRVATASSIADALAPAGDMIGTAGSDETIRLLSGEIADAQALFDQLTQGGTVVNNSYPGVWVQLADGSQLGLRTVATRSPGVVATIDVNVPGIALRKIKFKP